MEPRPTICINIELEEAHLAKLRRAGELVQLERGAPRGDLLAALADAQALLGFTQVDAELFDAAPALRVIATSSVGYDFIDVDEATRRGVAICNTPGVLNGAVADLTAALILMLARRLPEFEAYARSGGWARREPMPPVAHDVAGKTLGVIGFGRIGREVTRRGLALGMETVWHDVFDRPPADAPPSSYRALDELLREADFVSIHTDLNDSSRHLIGARELGLMKNSAYLINTSRGGAVDQRALTAALRSGDIAGAGLDVFEQEPPAADEPLMQLSNVVVLPHIGTATAETRRAMRGLAVDNVVAVLAGQAPPAIVNPEVLP